MLVRVEMLLIFLLSVAVSAWVVAEFFLSPLLTPSPYGDVQLEDVRANGQTVHVVASFEKYGCTFQRLDVIWGEAGLTGFLDWTDDDGTPPNVDRIAGRQTLRIAVDTRGRYLDWIEIRTRHDCDGDVIDRTFAHIDLPLPQSDYMEGAE